MASTYRCKGCRNFFPSGEEFRQVGLSKVCSNECLREATKSSTPKYKTRDSKPKPRKSKTRGLSSGSNPPPGVRAEVLLRDKGRCRFCLQPSHIQHHIQYRSEGVDHQRHNLIVLCQAHHDLVHSNKRKWQPLLRAYIWLYYVEGQQLTIPTIERKFHDQGQPQD